MNNVKVSMMASQHKSREVLHKKLQVCIERAIATKDVEIMPASPFKNIEEFTGLFDSIESNRGIIKTPYQDVVVEIEDAFIHFTKNTYYKNRENIKGGFFSTFRDPLFIVEKPKNGRSVPSTYFYKPFYDKDKNIMSLFGIGISKNGKINFKTYYFDARGNRLNEILNSRNVVIRYIKK